MMMNIMNIMRKRRSPNPNLNLNPPENLKEREGNPQHHQDVKITGTRITSDTNPCISRKKNSLLYSTA
jgi:hypothetical protein